jgi:hypothetical protein
MKIYSLYNVGVSLESISQIQGTCDPSDTIRRYFNQIDPSMDRDIEFLMSSGIQRAELTELKISDDKSDA